MKNLLEPISVYRTHQRTFALTSQVYRVYVRYRYAGKLQPSVRPVSSRLQATIMFYHTSGHTVRMVLKTWEPPILPLTKWLEDAAIYPRYWILEYR